MYINMRIVMKIVTVNEIGILVLTNIFCFDADDYASAIVPKYCH